VILIEEDIVCHYCIILSNLQVLPIFAPARSLSSGAAAFRGRQAWLGGHGRAKPRSREAHGPRAKHHLKCDFFFSKVHQNAFRKKYDFTTY
jgi:hypothetical protein